MKIFIVILLILIFSICCCNGLKTITSLNNNRRIITKLRMNDKKINDDDGKTSGTFGFLGGLGCASSFNIDYTLYVLKTTGCNIIPSPKYGPYTLIAEESFSLLIIIGIFIWSILVKKDTGKGLPAGPAGLLGAAEGLSFLTVLLLLIFVPWQFLDYGGITQSLCSLTP